jgi:hypothetical protein
MDQNFDKPINVWFWPDRTTHKSESDEESEPEEEEVEEDEIEYEVRLLYKRYFLEIKKFLNANFFKPLSMFYILIFLYFQFPKSASREASNDQQLFENIQLLRVLWNTVRRS